MNTASDIAQTFRDFYADLYNVRDTLSPKSIEERHRKMFHYLQQAQLPKLTNEFLEKLESEFMEEEFYAALKSTPTGKSLSPDGYTITYYKEFKQNLVPHLTSYANSIAGSEGFRSD